MKAYLNSIIDEQVNRSLSLKKLIPYPIYPTLSGVAERCTNILQEQIDLLNAIKSELPFRDDSNIKDLFRQIRICARDISHVEYYGLPALYYKTDEVGLLNQILLSIHNEIKLPFPHPAVCCTSNKYYFSVPLTNTIFVPLGESEFLLHLPDLYHELGHYVLVNMMNELRLKPVKEAYEKSLLVINNYFDDLVRSKKREYGPKEILYSIDRIREQWTEYWMVEFFCDLFAVYALGPAYVWSHLHLTTKISSDVYSLSVLLAQTHPSDDSRMKVLLEGLKLMSFDDEIKQIENKWNEMIKFLPAPATMYQYAFPSELLKNIAKIVLDALKQSGLSLVTKENWYNNKNANEMRFLFNEAWDRFWRKSGAEFRAWEESKIVELKKQVKSTLINS